MRHGPRMSVSNSAPTFNSSDFSDTFIEASRPVAAPWIARSVAELIGISSPQPRCHRVRRQVQPADQPTVATLLMQLCQCQTKIAHFGQIRLPGAVTHSRQGKPLLPPVAIGRESPGDSKPECPVPPTHRASGMRPLRFPPNALPPRRSCPSPGATVPPVVLPRSRQQRPQQKSQSHLATTSLIPTS